MNKRRVAIHEAGHVVANLVLGVPMQYATIRRDPDRGSAGHVETWGVPVGCDTQVERRQQVRNMLVAGYAGRAAEELFGLQDDDNADERDKREAARLSAEYGVVPRYLEYVGDERHQRYLERFRIRAKRLVE